jgi:hypothetical protein
VNAPPSAGKFLVSPEKGLEMKTLFEFSASEWSDTDIPLNYIFGIRKFDSKYSMYSNIILQTQSEVSYGSILLPREISPNNYVSCFGQVLDIYSANSTLYYDALVSKQETIELKEILSNLNSSHLEVLTGRIDQVYQTIIGTLALGNNIDCAKAPDCLKLNRFLNTVLEKRNFIPVFF